MFAISQVSAALMDEEAFNQCQQEVLAMMSSEYDSGCSDEYSEEELEQLEQVGELASGIMCLQKTFSDSCADYIENELIYMIQAASTMDLAGKWLCYYSNVYVHSMKNNNWQY